MRKRIISNEFGQFAIQSYSENYGWDFCELTDIINIMGNEVECPVQPIWYYSYDEALGKINYNDELFPSVILGVDDNKFIENNNN